MSRPLLRSGLAAPTVAEPEGRDLLASLLPYEEQDTRLVMCPDLAALIRYPVPRGALLLTEKQRRLYVVSAKAGRMALAHGPIRRLRGMDAEVTLRSESVGLLREGDMLRSANGDFPAGVATAVEGEKVSLAAVTHDVPEDTCLCLAWEPIVHTPTLGSFSPSEAQIGLVTDLGTWQVGDRVRAAGIVDGTYITKILGQTFMLSKAPFASGTRARLFDADLSYVDLAPL